MGIGASQVAPPGPGVYDMPGACTANAPHANGQPPGLIATGTLNLTTMSGGGAYEIHTTYTGANFWDMYQLVQAALIQEDQLILTVVPEPSSLALVGIAVMALIRRK